MSYYYLRVLNASSNVQKKFIKWNLKNILEYLIESVRLNVC